MNPGRFVSAGVHWGVSVFLLQPTLRGRIHFLGFFALRSCIFSCTGVGLSPPLGCFGQIFGMVLCYFGGGNAVRFCFWFFYRGSTSAIFRVFVVLLLSGSVFVGQITLQSNLFRPMVLTFGNLGCRNLLVFQGEMLPFFFRLLLR